MYRLIVVMAMVFGTGASQAQTDIKGDWIVRELKSTTYTLDGKEKIKGPFLANPSNDRLHVTDRTFVYVVDGKRTEYKLLRQRNVYRLARKEEGKPLNVTLTAISRTGSSLTFTSVHLRREHDERQVVRISCIRDTGSAKAALTDTKWELVEIEHKDDAILHPADGETITLDFGTDAVTGKAGHNSFRGNYQADRSSKIAFKPLISTRVADPPGFISPSFLKDLQVAERFKMSNSDLVLHLPNGGVLRFRSR